MQPPKGKQKYQRKMVDWPSRACNLEAFEQLSFVCTLLSSKKINKTLQCCKCLFQRLLRLWIKTDNALNCWRVASSAKNKHCYPCKSPEVHTGFSIWLYPPVCILRSGESPCGSGRRGHHNTELSMGWAASAHREPIVWAALPALQPPAVLTPINCTHCVFNTLAHTHSLTLRCCPAHWQQIWENVKFLRFWEAQWDSLSTQLNRKMPLISEAGQPDPWSFIGKCFDSVTDEIS